MTPPADDDVLATCRALLRAMGTAAWLVDASTQRVVAANAEAQALLGRPAHRLVGADAQALIDTPADIAYWDDVRAGHVEALCSDAVLVNALGQTLSVTRRIRPLQLGARHRQLLVTVDDQTESRRQLDASDAMVAELQSTLESTADGILVTDLNGRIRAFNRRFAQVWDLPHSLLLTRHDEAVFDWMRRSVVDPLAYQRRLDAIGADAAAQCSERVVLSCGRVLLRVTQPQLRLGRPSGRVWSYRDQTELVLAGRRIESLTTTDALTGLVNRHQVTFKLDESIRQAARCAGTLALLVLDLDRFKLINDSLGTRVGDQVLLGATERLRSCLRQGDIVARVGDDRFALLLHHTDHRGAESVARHVLEAIAQPCAMEGLQFTLTCSVGIALYPSDGASADQLLRNAETAMQRAKLGGRACFRFHQARHDADLRQRMRLDHAMRQALASQRFRLKYQPQIDLRSGATVGAEALIRWRDPELGDVAPDEFIPVAEDSGFIVTLGDWVLSQAVRQAAAWRRGGIDMPVAINVSALQLQQADFAERVGAALREHALPGHLLELELTESILVRDADDVFERLSQLARLQVRLAIDDFGTGYSSLSYLKRFPIRRLKIDHSFVDGLPADDSDAAIVRAIVQMSRALGLRVVAEGVETEAQRAFLQQVGCDEYQGTLHAPALDPISFEERIGGAQLADRPRLTLVAGN